MIDWKICNKTGIDYYTKTEVLHGQTVEVKVYRSHVDLEIPWLTKLESMTEGLEISYNEEDEEDEQDDI